MFEYGTPTHLYEEFSLTFTHVHEFIFIEVGLIKPI